MFSERMDLHTNYIFTKLSYPYNFVIKLRSHQSVDPCDKGFYLLLNFLRLTEFVAGVETVAEGQLGFLLEHHHVARPSEDEVSEVVSLLDCVPWEH
jgi:hypothetical protein